jgi:hypothetical protein
MQTLIKVKPEMQKDCQNWYQAGDFGLASKGSSSACISHSQRSNNENYIDHKRHRRRDFRPHHASDSDQNPSEGVKPTQNNPLPDRKLLHDVGTFSSWPDEDIDQSDE